MILSDTGNCWGLYVIASNGPTFLKYMLGVDIKTNGILSGLPWLSRYLGGVLSGLIADYLLSHEIFSVLWVRRIFNSICMCGPGIVMLILGFPPFGFQGIIHFVPNQENYSVKNQ